MKQRYTLFSLSLLVSVTLLSTINARPSPNDNLVEDKSGEQLKRQIASDFGESLLSSIDAQNSAIQSSISVQGTSLFNSIKSVTESRSTVPFSQASDGTCNGISINGRCCVGSTINNVCYVPDSNQNQGNRTITSASQAIQSTRATPTPTSASTSASPSSSTSSNRNNGALSKFRPTETVSIMFFCLNIIFWI